MGMKRDQEGDLRGKPQTGTRQRFRCCVEGGHVQAAERRGSSRGAVERAQSGEGKSCLAMPLAPMDQAGRARRLPVSRWTADGPRADFGPTPNIS